MKKFDEKSKVIIGILLAPALIVLMMAAFILAGKDKHTIREQAEQGEPYTTEVQELATLKKKGYILYRKIPDHIKRLARSDVFQKFNEEDSGVELEMLATTDSERFGDEYASCVVGERQSFPCYLEFDAKAFRFTEEEKIRRVEECGYSGFEKQLAKVADIVKEKTQEHGDSYWHYAWERYQLSCQGTTITLERTSDGNFTMFLNINLSTCWVPGKYKDLIERVDAAGGYYLFSSCVGGEVEILTFCKDNSIAEGGSVEGGESLVDNKRLVLMFRDGKLEDYYMTTAGSELELDSSDQNMLKLCTAGLNKTLPEKETMVSQYQGVYRIYRAVTIHGRSSVHS